MVKLVSALVVLFAATAFAAEQRTQQEVELLKELKASKVFSGVAKQLESGSPAEAILSSLKEVSTLIVNERKQIVSLRSQSEADFTKEIAGNRRVLNATRAMLGKQVKCMEDALLGVLRVGESQELTTKQIISQQVINKWERKAGNISRVQTRLMENFKADLDDLAQRQLRLTHSKKIVQNVVDVIERHYTPAAAPKLAVDPTRPWLKAGEVAGSLLELAAVAPEAAAIAASATADDSKSSSEQTGSLILQTLTKLEQKFDQQGLMLGEEKDVVKRDFEEKKLHLTTAYNETYKIIKDAQRKNKDLDAKLGRLRDEKKALERTKSSCNKKMAALQATEKKDLMALQESKAAMKSRLRIYDKNLELINGEYKLANYVVELVMKRVSQIRNIIRKSLAEKVKDKLAAGGTPATGTGETSSDADVAAGVAGDAKVAEAKKAADEAQKDAGKAKAEKEVAEASGDEAASAAAKAKVKEANMKLKAATKKADKAVNDAVEKSAAPESKIEKEIKEAQTKCAFSKENINSPCFPGQSCEKDFTSDKCVKKTKLYCIEVGTDDAACVGEGAKKMNITVCPSFAAGNPDESIDHDFYKKACEGSEGMSGCSYRRQETTVGIGECLNKNCISGSKYWCQNEVTMTECRVDKAECDASLGLDTPTPSVDANIANKAKEADSKAKDAETSAAAAGAAASATTATGAETELEEATRKAAEAHKHVETTVARFKAVQMGATVPAKTAYKALLRHN